MATVRRRGGGEQFTLFCDQRTECRLEGWMKKKGRGGRGGRLKGVELHRKKTDDDDDE